MRGSNGIYKKSALFFLTIATVMVFGQSALAARAIQITENNGYVFDNFDIKTWNRYQLKCRCNPGGAGFNATLYDEYGIVRPTPIIVYPSHIKTTRVEIWPGSHRIILIQRDNDNRSSGQCALLEQGDYGVME